MYLHEEEYNNVLNVTNSDKFMRLVIRINKKFNYAYVLWQDIFELNLISELNWSNDDNIKDYSIYIINGNSCETIKDKNSNEIKLGKKIFIKEYEKSDDCYVTHYYKEENKNNEKDGNSMNEMNSMFGGMSFGSINTDDFRISMNGLAIKASEDKYVAFDISNNTLTDVTPMSFDAKGMLFKMPVNVKDIKRGDIIIHNEKPVIITKIDENDEIEIINPFTATNDKIILIKNMFGFTCVTKIVNMMNVSGINPMMMSGNMDFNPMMLMMSGMKDINPMMLMYMMNMNNK